MSSTDSFVSSVSVQHLSISSLLQAQAQRAPKAVAIAARGRKPLTYGQLFDQIDAGAKVLNAAGIGRNDRVALVLSNGPEMATAFLAVAACATCAPLNPACKFDEFEFCLADLQAKAVIVLSGANSPVVAAAHKRSIPIIELSPVQEAEAGIFTLTAQKQSRPKCSGLAESADIALALHTSGTTSKPKLVPLTQANVCTSAYNTADVLELSSRDRCLNVMPLFHIHGLMVILSSMAAGGNVVCLSDSDLSDFFVLMEEFHPSWYSASPTIHQAILAQAKRHRKTIIQCPLRFLRSSSSPLPATILAELESAFKAVVVESYAMTEASYQISSNPLPPGKRKAGSVGVAAGPEVAIMDELGNLLARGNTGEVVIRGPNVTRGYENAPAANAVDFTNGWFRTGDQGHMDRDGYLFITGRLKEIINRGGEKISPHEVDDVIMQHPAVAEVATFAMPHPSLGEDVAAAIVLREDFFARENEIRAFASKRLADFKVPRRILIIDEIPKGRTGKLQRVGLAQKLGLTADARTGPGTKSNYVAPRNPAEAMLVAIWGQLLNLEKIGVEDNFFDIGGHSLLALCLLGQIAKTVGRNLRLNVLFQAPTIEQLAKLLREEEPPSRWTSLVPLQPNGSKPPFFWVHGDYSNAFLHRYLDINQPLYGLMHQSEDGRRACYGSVEEIAAHYLEEIRTVQPSGPYFLGGYSFGGTVAFEMAQQLTNQGEEVGLLFFLDSLFPGNGCSDEVSMNGGFSGDAHRHLRNIAPLRAEEKIRYILVRIRGRIKGKSDEIMRTISRMLKRAVYSSYLAIGHPIPFSLRSRYILDIYAQARKNYIPQPYPGRAIYIKSEKAAVDHRLNWGRVIAGGLEVHEVPGDHMTIIKEPDAGLWAVHLRRCLNMAQAEIQSGYNKPMNESFDTANGSVI